MQTTDRTTSSESFNRELFEKRFQDLEVSERERERIAWTVAHVPKDATTVLEVGSGDSRLANALANCGYQMTGVDLVATALGLLRGGRVQGSAMLLPFKADAFDLVLCAEVIEHLSAAERQRTLAELWRVARRYVLITTPDDEDLADDSVACDRCGHVFNAWGHIASFDRGSFAALLPLRPRVVDSLRFRARGYFRPLRFVRHKILHTYGHAEHLVCPACRNNRVNEPKRSFIVRCSDRLNYLLGTTRHVGWLLGVWDKSQAR